MFSGIITAIGCVYDIQTFATDRHFVIAYQDLDVSDLKLGDSLAINGVCLSVTHWQAPHLVVDVSQETLSCTTFVHMNCGDLVNLEKPLRLTDGLHGHLVSGHVDGIGKIISCDAAGRSVCIRIKFPQALAKYIAAKGSVCVDGVSLTINEVIEDYFSVNLIPHTLESTIFNSYAVGVQVNLEVDMIARYLERLLVVQDLS